MSHTVKKEEIKAAIDQIPAEQLDTLDKFIRSLASAHRKPKAPGETFMEKMRKIKFDGPPDFSENIDAYLNGDKQI
ncbi:MAG: hypothetical protein ACRD6X_13015 [Pyrinomonadaceae bacterium]